MLCGFVRRFAVRSLELLQLGAVLRDGCGARVRVGGSVKCALTHTSAHAHMHTRGEQVDKLCINPSLRFVLVSMSWPERHTCVELGLLLSRGVLIALELTQDFLRLVQLGRCIAQKLLLLSNLHYGAASAEHDV